MNAVQKKHIEKGIENLEYELKITEFDITHAVNSIELCEKKIKEYIINIAKLKEGL